ncbi:MAG TPA: DUF5681 domain-containing protein [Gemmatimonadaceae bacterium]|nr:DUF5681 domain-containing protein [Gemmatimonadaceae bacterium]
MFQPGQSGNPAGRRMGSPNKVTQEIRDAARAIIENRAYVTKLKARLIDGKAPHMEVLLFHYAYGKPQETLNIDQRGDMNLQITWMPHVLALPAAE